MLIFSLYSPDILIQQDNAKGAGMIIQCIKQYNRKKRIRLRTLSSSFQQATANSMEIKSEVLKLTTSHILHSQRKSENNKRLTKTNEKLRTHFVELMKCTCLPRSGCRWSLVIAQHRVIGEYLRSKLTESKAKNENLQTKIDYSMYFTMQTTL